MYCKPLLPHCIQWCAVEWVDVSTITHYNYCVIVRTVSKYMYYILGICIFPLYNLEGLGTRPIWIFFCFCRTEAVAVQAETCINGGVAVGALLLPPLHVPWLLQYMLLYLFLLIGRNDMGRYGLCVPLDGSAVWLVLRANIGCTPLAKSWSQPRHRVGWGCIRPIMSVVVSLVSAASRSIKCLASLSSCCICATTSCFVK